MSPAPDSTLEPQQLIAELQRELAEAVTERDEAQAQRAAIAEILEVINSSAGDLPPVLHAILEKAMRLCEADGGYFLRYQDGKHVLAAERGLQTALSAFLSRQDQPEVGSPAALVAQGAPYIHIADLKDDDLYRSGAPRRRAIVDLGGLCTGITVPMRRDDVLLGTFNLGRSEIRPFTDKQITLVQNFAAQAVIAIENARLITETREALEQQTATAEVLQVINSSPGDLTPVFDVMLKTAARLCSADIGMISYRETDGFRVAATFSHTPEYEAFMKNRLLPANRGSVAGRAALERRPIQISDITSDQDYAITQSSTLANIRTALGVPLLREQVVVGVISLGRDRVQPFTDRQIELVSAFAAQAVIAMENARLITETREALEQQTATAEVLHVINSSPGDLGPVFDAMLEKAMRLCEAVFGTLFTYDGALFHTAAYQGEPGYGDWLRQASPFRPERAVTFQRILRGADIVHIADVLEDEAYRGNEPDARAAVEISGMRTLITVPLRKEDVLLGAITVYRQEVRPFTDKQIALLQNFAAQAVIAMENARLITETREALEQQTATAEVLGVINSSPGELGPVFDAMLEKTLRLCEAAHGNFLTYDGEVFHQAAFRGEPQFVEYGRQQGPLRPAEEGQLARIVQGGGTLHRIDAREGEAYRDDPAFRQNVDRLGIRTSLTVPLRKGDALLGAVRAYRLEVRPFTDKQIALVENFAAQAVIAMENARLLGELRQRTEEVGELNRDLEARVAEQVEELGRVGRLKRFLAPQLAELIVSQGDEKILESHRREIVVVFCDLRGYTAFTETAEPEEVLDFLREYHGALGPLVSQFEGTLDQFSGDGIMVFFNDPVPIPDPAERAVKMAVAMRSAASTLISRWRERGRDLGFGAGIAQGYATLGQIGFSERSGYTAIGTVCNVAARLCAEAKDGQILLGQRVNVELNGSVATEQLGPLTLKGLTQPVVAYNVPLGVNQPALRVIEGGPQSV